MADGAPPGDKGLDPLRDGREIAGDAYTRAEAMITRGQNRVFRFFWLFLPEPEVAKRSPFQFLLASVFLSDAARDAIRYGALIAVVRGGGSTLESAFVGAVSLVPPTLFGLYGGAVADALPKRLALGAIYILDGALCFFIPTVYGTGLGAILVLVFTVGMLSQISGPQEQSITPLVASDAELATATSLSTLASNLGTIFGTALLAPILVKEFGVYAVFYLSGLLLFLASGRILNVRTVQDDAKFKWKRPDIDIRSTVKWLIDRPPVATMIVVAVLAGTANLVVQTLGPRYVQEVLGLDPANAVYVFAPSAIGLALALIVAPFAIRKIGERPVALMGFVLVSASLCLLGFAGRDVTGVTDPFNPLRVLTFAGISMGGPLRTAAFLAMPLGFGMSLTTTSVQTYINRRVPLSYQGRAFALQSTLKNGAAIIPLLSLGALAGVFGVDTMLIISPLALILLAFGLVRLSSRLAGAGSVSGLEVLSSFWEEPPREGAIADTEPAPAATNSP